MRSAPGPIQFHRPPVAPDVRIFRLEREERPHTSYSEAYAIVLVLEGAFDGWYRGAVHTHAQGQLKLKEPGEVHRDVKVHAPFSLQGVAFEPGALEHAAEALGLPRQVHFTRAAVPAHAKATALAVRMHRALAAVGTTELEAQTTIAEALAEVVRSFTETSRAPASHRAPRAVARAREYLRAHFTDKVCLDDVAHHAGLDKFHLVRLFRDEIGLPPYEYLTHVRVARAAELLAGGASSAEVAIAVGLYDESQLHRHFRRIVGLPPGRYGRSLSVPSARQRATRGTAPLEKRQDRPIAPRPTGAP